MINKKICNLFYQCRSEYKKMLHKSYKDSCLVYNLPKQKYCDNEYCRICSSNYVYTYSFNEKMIKDIKEKFKHHTMNISKYTTFKIAKGEDVIITTNKSKWKDNNFNMKVISKKEYDENTFYGIVISDIKNLIIKKSIYTLYILPIDEFNKIKNQYRGYRF